MIDGEILQVFSVCVRFEVINKSQNNSDRLFRPSTKSLTELSGLSSSTDSTEMFKVRNASSVSEDVLEVLFGFGDGEALDGVGCFIGIFVVDSEIFG